MSRYLLTYLYSLRDKNNNPHATIEVFYSSYTEKQKIEQIKGKGNGSIHPNYINLIMAFINKVGLTLKSYELSNLGYNKLKEEQYFDLKKIEGLKFFNYQKENYLFIHSKPKITNQRR